MIVCLFDAFLPSYFFACNEDEKGWSDKSVWNWVDWNVKRSKDGNEDKTKWMNKNEGKEGKREDERMLMLFSLHGSLSRIIRLANSKARLWLLAYVSCE